MSVINKMLRDLDQRQASQTTPLPGAAAAGTRTLPFGKPPSSGASSRRGLWLGLLLAVVVAAGAAGWWLQAGGQLPGGMGLGTAPPAPTPAPPSVAAPPAAVATPAASAPDVAQPASVAAQELKPADTPPANAAADAPGAMVLRMESSLSARRALDALLSTPAPAPVVAAAPPAPAPPAAERNKPRPAAASAPVPVAPSHVPTMVGDSTPVLQRQQQAGGDALAQAQTLWASGSRDAAIDLVQQSIAVAERAAKSTGSAGANPVLLPLVRELARMQLAEGRYGPVWETLTRLEPLLGNQPDLWAIRANAAQRLGRHPDSVHAYMMALQSRPDEQRWLLGTAVSLAALGQTASAAEMTEKARAVGPVSKDILAYLRQAGVPLKD